MQLDVVGALWRLSMILAGALLTVAATAAVAAASGYGELQHFGTAGTRLGELEATEEAAAFGIDPTDNSVYVADLPDQNEEFRMQKFSANAKGEYEAVASVEFRPHDPEGATDPDTVEGVAVDPALKRVYVLAAELRPASRKVDAEREAAATLFAFSTEPSGGSLVPAPGTTNEGKQIGVLASASVLSPTSNKLGVSLLEPSGIAVDPTNHEVIILGEQESATGEPLVALQRVTDEGRLGARYVDKTNYFEGEGATSPAVSAAGHVYVVGFDEIDEIPSNFTASTAPKPFIQFTPELERLTEFPGEPASVSGGALSIGAEGTIYAKAGIAQQLKGQTNGFMYPGVIEFTPAGSEEGWTGGQSEASDGSGGPCQLGFQSVPLIAAGKGHDVFAYDTNPATPRIIEFGPGGSGCASATATPPAANVDGVRVSESEPIPIADDVTLTSRVTQANALSVTWEFGDGTAETVDTRQGQTTEVTHQFTKSGELEITEKIHNDDLATPEIITHSKIDISG
jgi:hypothetical protein